jgi:probable rRNA maturation factor
MLPNLFWANRQRTVRLDLPKIRRIVAVALRMCVEKPRTKGVVLPPEVEITLLGEAAIAKVHGEFLEDPTPTDVITFEYGEILIGVPIAAANARRFRHPVDHEVALCAIHGLLHLLGYDDLTEKERVIMHARQEEILKAALRLAC